MKDSERRAKVDEMLAWPLAAQFDSMDPLDRPFVMAQIIIRQRYAEMHDPGCSKAIVEQIQRENWDVAYQKKKCTCWLIRCVLGDCDGTAAETGPRRLQVYAVKQEEGEWYDAPSIAVIRECSRCKQRVQICTEGHCMYCGMTTLADLR